MKKVKRHGIINEQRKNIYIFDTTLRDGAQTEGVDFSVEDKNKISKILSNIGVDYIEGGWPGANPIDNEFFDKSPKSRKLQNLQHLE